MKTAKILTILVMALGLLAYSAQFASAGPMGTAFTYQGQLYDASYPANGQYDFAFKLYDANSNGNKVGTDVNVADVNVIDGYFTVEPNFGGGVFVGNEVWLEIGIRPGEQSDPCGYTTLSPRQEVTPAPYALYTGLAGDAGTLGGYQASDFIKTSQDYGRSGVSSTLYEGTTALSNKYLGISATATNSDRVDGYDAGNSSGQVAVSNGTLCSNLNADMVDGYHAGSFVQASSDYGRSGVSSTLYEGTTPLSNKYLGISATATNSDRVDGYDAGNSSGQVAVSNGTLCTNLNADRVDGYHAGNSSGQVSVSNGTLCSNLNADMVDGYHAGSFVQASSDYGRSGVSSTLYEGTTALASKYLGISATAQNSYGLVLPFSGSASTGSYGISVTHTLTNSDSPAVLGTHDVMDWYGVGVKGVGGYKGIVAECTPTGSQIYYGIESTCNGGSGANLGIRSYAESSGSDYGVYGEAASSGTGISYGVYGYASGVGSGAKYGVYGSTASGSGTRYAGYFYGNVNVTGTLSKGSGSFKIDHPLDPENKYLCHSFVESPDMMNVYNGNIELDANGTAVVELPKWFGVLNRDFRYQLTCIGGFAPVYIAKEITNNSFTIAGGMRGMKVSWQVTGIRQDPFANENRIQVEMDKSPEERGKYLYPKAYGLDENMSIDQHIRPEQEVKMKEVQ
jgi:hypothetical protein